MKRLWIVLLLPATFAVTNCVVVSPSGSPSAPAGSALVPSIDLNERDNAATVRFSNGHEVLFAPNGQMVKWSPGTTEAEKAAARRAYRAAVNEKTATPEDYRDV